ncbi:MAG: hypothetical protein ACREL7_16925 [Longimicrobiales bacterium]
MSVRRYSEEEVAAIFANAADAQKMSRRPVSSGSGMTLSELQEIGREVGISPEEVAHAASLVDQSAKPTGRRFLGLPIGVGKTIELGRMLSDAEWERLVVDLRETFDARGTVSAHGSFRQWTNGNLQALLEPTATGHRLRLKTLKGSSRSSMIAGLGTLGVAAATLIGGALGGGLDAGALGSIGTMAAVGLGLFGLGAVRLPSWASLRRRQMDGVVSRLAPVPARDLPVPGHGENPRA